MTDEMIAEFAADELFNKWRELTVNWQGAFGGDIDKAMEARHKLIASEILKAIKKSKETK